MARSADDEQMFAALVGARRIHRRSPPLIAAVDSVAANGAIEKNVDRQ